MGVDNKEYEANTLEVWDKKKGVCVKNYTGTVDKDCNGLLGSQCVDSPTCPGGSFKVGVCNKKKNNLAQSSCCMPNNKKGTLPAFDDLYAIGCEVKPAEPKMPENTQPVDICDPLCGPNTCQCGATIITVINRIILAFLQIVGALALAVFVYGGVVYLMAGGSEERVTHAKSVMKYGFIGLAIIMFAYMLARTFLKIFTG